MTVEEDIKNSAVQTGLVILLRDLRVITEDEYWNLSFTYSGVVLYNSVIRPRV